MLFDVWRGPCVVLWWIVLLSVLLWLWRGAWICWRRGVRFVGISWRRVVGHRRLAAFGRCRCPKLFGIVDWKRILGLWCLGIWLYLLFSFSSRRSSGAGHQVLLSFLHIQKIICQPEVALWDFLYHLLQVKHQMTLGSRRHSEHLQLTSHAIAPSPSLSTHHTHP